MTCESFDGFGKYKLPVAYHCLCTSCSGGQNITIIGRNFDVIDNLVISHELKGNMNVSGRIIFAHNFVFPSLSCVRGGLYFISTTLAFSSPAPL